MIRFNKLTIDKKDLESVLYCMIKDDLNSGEYRKSFSKELAQRVQLPNVAVFNAYFHSFVTIFHLLQCQPGDEVILPSFSRYGILSCIEKCRLVPILVDVEKESFLPSFEKVRRNINKKTRCIIISQMFGIPHDITAYREFGVPLIEDVDGSLDSAVNEKKIGSFGDFVTMNFNDTSVITTGTGGMVASKDARLKLMIRSHRDDQAWMDCLMSDFNASLGISQIYKLEKNIEARKKIAGFYDNAVFAANCEFIGRAEDKVLSFTSYVVKTQTPFHECARFFKKFGIPVRKGIEKPLHSYLGADVKEFTHTEELYNNLIALPIYPALSKVDIEKIVKGIRAIL
jgi:dTDP-4-amino-4,6-dideoxygalactose transaminase